ncbi:single-stranded DNA-binding protein [Nesterenkonia xinjiangensis]|uniref:Single-stranded DNA-binding protein n=1 Tax=Nesterenkonia xinjiangensis TaxID=225327 RepID=A0A7Z0GQV1_9MICC|nr:single-stranded DNA-binding protein [Nesterenkonia xinjiangensis]NYJ79606.1 single-strand DNA-binding protein [Nesterenkonia xinjiangensis]
MNETVTVRGFIGNEVRTITTDKGLPISSFRLASTPRRFDRERGEWVDGETNWFTVTCFRALAQNVRTTVSKGDPVLVTGRLKVRQWANDTGQRGTSVEIDADGVGHDLTFGTGSFIRLGGQPADSASGWGTAGAGLTPTEDAADLADSDARDPGPDAAAGAGHGSSPEVSPGGDEELAGAETVDAPF